MLNYPLFKFFFFLFLFFSSKKVHSCRTPVDVHADVRVIRRFVAIFRYPSVAKKIHGCPLAGLVLFILHSLSRLLGDSRVLRRFLLFSFSSYALCVCLRPYCVHFLFLDTFVDNPMAAPDPHNPREFVSDVCVPGSFESSRRRCS